jgi:hypothetical protein
MLIYEISRYWALRMYRKCPNGPLSIEQFHVFFGSTLVTGNRWVIFASLMPRNELDEIDTSQFIPTTEAPAKPLRLAFGAS